MIQKFRGVALGDPVAKERNVIGFHSNQKKLSKIIKFIPFESPFKILKKSIRNMI